MKSFLVTFLFAIATSIACYAQPDSGIKVVKLINGNEYVGKIISDDGRELLIETNNVGKIYLLKSEVKSISEYNAEDFTILNDEKVKSTAFSTRYTFTTNALPIKKKDNYYMLNIWGPEFHMAVADNFNVGVMTSWIGSPFAVAAKYSLETKNPKLNFSIGEIAGTMGYFDLYSYISLSFANVTIGDRDKNITLGGGYGIFDFNQTKEVAGNYYWDQNNGGYINAATGVHYSYIPEVRKKASQGFIGSVGAHVRISDKSSFVFDSMFGLMDTDNTSRDYSTNYDVSIRNQNKTPFFIFMPGLRLEQGEGKAVQFCIAGANVNNLTRPFPYVTWFRKL